MAEKVLAKGTIAFQAEGRLLQELGERLVASPEVALVELIKNAYDADSPSCEVRLGDSGKSLVISDKGHGMTLDEFSEKWMRIATSSKIGKRVSRIYGRRLTGAKGIGRFAVRSLGDYLTLTSVALDPRRKTNAQLTARFDWPKIDRLSDIRNAKVDYTLEQMPSDTPTGTTLEVPILMTLADFDPGGRLANRPLNSLREIFLAWRPNTYASLEDRIAVFRAICRKRPRVGLQLAMSLLPESHGISGGTAKPHLRDFGEAKSKATTVADMQYAYRQFADVAVELAGRDISRLTALVDSLPQLDAATRERAILAISTSAKDGSSDTVFQLWSKLHHFVQKHRNFPDAAWALKPDQLKPLEELCRTIEPADPVRQIVWLFDDYAPKAGYPLGQDYIGAANRDRSEALRVLLREHGISAVLDLARTAKLPHFVGVALAEASPNLGTLQEAISLATAAGSGVSIDFAMALSAAANNLHGPAWDSWIGRFATTLEPGTAASLFLRWPDSRKTWDFVGSLSPTVEKEYWNRKWAFRQSSPEDLAFVFDKYAEVERFSAILDMIAYDENLLSTPQCIQLLRGLIRELNKETWKLQRVQYEVVHMIQALQEREDVDLGDLAAIEYQYLPVLEFQAEPTALNRLLGTSPQLFVNVICDAFSPASGEKGEITDERRLRARLAYRLLQSIKTVPGFSSGAEDVNHLRSWISEVRTLAKEADRAVITDQQIGQILAYAPSDSEDAAWPSKAIRDLIEELEAEQVERGIAISRFNQRGSFSKGLYDGGKQERALANQYRNWADVTRKWLRTSALLRQIADDWDRYAKRADSEAELDQLRDS